MNTQRIQSLFRAARRAPAATPPTQFSQRVMRAIRREPLAPSLTEQLTALFPRLALAAGLVLLLGLGVEFWFSVLEPGPSVLAGEVLTEQWLFATTGD